MIPLNCYYKDFLAGGILGFDTETRDPDLRELGPGQYRKGGYIAGYSLAAPSGASSYFDLQHPDTDAETRERNLKFLALVLSKRPPLVTANGIYDIDWLQNTRMHTGQYFPVPPDVYDVQWAEALLDEYGSFALNSLCRKYRLPLKREAGMLMWCAEHGISGPPQEHIYKMPAEVPAEYAAYDAECALSIHLRQVPLLKEQGLSPLYALERAQMPILAHMRKTGVRIDVDKLLAVERHLELQMDQWGRRLKLFAKDPRFNPKSSAECARMFERLGVEYPCNTPTERMKIEGKAGSPQINTEFLDRIADKVPAARTLKEWRHMQTLASTFVEPYKQFVTNGRIHAQFHPLRSDTYGTVSGRFSSSRPNLQQVDKSFIDLGGGLRGKLIRELFIPEEGCLWASADQSQEEYRLIAHYASGPGADAFRAQYNNNPDFDMHDYIVRETGFPRDNAKRLNFGGAYGLGATSCSNKFGWTMEQAKEFFATYHRKVPFLRPTRDRVIRTAQERGYIVTLLGRRARTHTTRKNSSMFNRLIQGSAGDIMKKSLVDCWNAGIFQTLPLHITVHDEIDVSVPRTKEGEEALKEMCRIMETCVKLSVPLKVDCKTGETWAHAH